MDENQINPETGIQHYQPLHAKLTAQTLPGNYQEEDSENLDKNFGKESPERTQRHDYKDPSADQIEDDEDDEAYTNGDIYTHDYDTNTDPADEQSPDVSNQDHVGH